MDTAGATRHSNTEPIPIAARLPSASLNACDTGAVLPAAGAVWPKDAAARIQKADRSVTTSGPARTKGWRLTFERRSPPVLDDLMGWTGGDDPLAQVELSFPTLEAAVRYAERQRLSYEIVPPPGAADRARAQQAAQVRAFSDRTLQRLGLEQLQDTYDRAMAGEAGRHDPVGVENWDDPMDVVVDPTLSIEAKRSVLMNWAWTEHLADQATAEGMPENDHPARLHEVEQALLALEGRGRTEIKAVPRDKLAA